MVTPTAPPTQISIGAILSPQLSGIEAAENNSLPYASSLCGACYEVCPVKINFPEVLVHLRAKDVESKHAIREFEGNKKAPFSQMDGMMLGAKKLFTSGKMMSIAERGLPMSRLISGTASTGLPLFPVSSAAGPLTATSPSPQGILPQLVEEGEGSGSGTR